MKKVMLVAAVSLVFGLAGCSKSKDCKCSIYQTIEGIDIPEGLGEQTSFEVRDYDGNCKDITYDQIEEFFSSDTEFTPKLKCVEK